MKNKIRSTQEWIPRPSDFEKGGGKKLTVPDDSYTIREILEKFTHNVSPEISKLAEWPDEEPDFDDDDLEALQRADMAEKLEKLSQAEETLKSRKKQAPPVQEQKSAKNPDSSSETQK